MRTPYILATSALVGLALTTPAIAADTKFYGQVSKAAMLADNGNDTRFVVGDNANVITRLGFASEVGIGNGLTASALIEGQMIDGDSSDTFTVQNDPTLDNVGAASAAAATFAENQARVGLAGAFGAAFIGRTSSATDGVTENSLANAGTLMNSGIYNMGGAIDLNPGVDAANVDDFNEHFSNFEGFSNVDNDRVNLVRYDSPVFNDLQFSAAVANGGDFDAALTYSHKYLSMEVKASLGYANFNQTGALGDADQWSGSVAVLHNSGLNAALAYGERDVNGSALDPTFWYAQVGYNTGNWGFAADYGLTEELVLADTEAKSWGLGAQYNFNSGISAGVLYRDLKLDIPAVTTTDGSVFGAVMTVKF